MTKKKSSPIKVAIGRLALSIWASAQIVAGIIAAYGLLGRMNSRQDKIMMLVVAVGIYIYVCFDTLDKGRQWKLIK